jgi:hypothetical protein
MENNKKVRELYSIYLELGHEVFEEKIKKPMELYLHANGNVISMNSLNTIIANAMEKSKLGEASFDENDLFSPLALVEKIYFDYTLPPIYDDYNDDYVIFSSPTFEEKISYDYNMPPVFNDYGDENNYFVESAPTTIVPVVSINTFMHVAHDRDALCDSYVVNSIHDATKSYYERGKHGLMDLNNIKFPLFMLQFLKLYLFCLPMLFALRFYDLSLYKTIFHWNWFRFKYVSYLLFDALYCFKFLYGAFVSSSYMVPT